eukprot:353438-Chlamydomonas_euryale.AAC.12
MQHEYMNWRGAGWRSKPDRWLEVAAGLRQPVDPLHSTLAIAKVAFADALANTPEEESASRWLPALLLLPGNDPWEASH